MCLNWADFTKNVSFKSYNAVCLPRRALVGHILVWERDHVPWSGIPGVLRVSYVLWQYYAPRVKHFSALHCVRWLRWCVQEVNYFMGSNLIGGLIIGVSTQTAYCMWMCVCKCVCTCVCVCTRVTTLTVCVCEWGGGFVWNLYTEAMCWLELWVGLLTN